MSGMAGLCRLDARRADLPQLRRMLRRLAHRGPDAEGLWCHEGVALGHRMLHTTPQSTGERLPATSSDGSVVLTADARIDNRDELIRTLAPREGLPSGIPDGELILSAYERWGERCPEYLLGDFAFAVWDRRRERLFCARDHSGVKPLYYHHRPGRLFAFASEIKGLLCLAEVPRVLDECRVAEFLQPYFDDQESTFYQGIRRLPPAHSLMVTPEGATLRRYWSLDPSREVRYGSDEEYARAFHQIFSEAVHCRLRSASPVGSSLSGGLDSSSIVCTARRLLREGTAGPLHTYSLLFPERPECDERLYIEAVLAGGGLVPRCLDGDALSPLEDLDRFLRHEDEPSWVLNMCLHWAMHRAAAADGVRVFLDGLGGDETVCHGIFHLSELLRRGRLLELTESVLRLARDFDRPPLRILRRHAIRPLLPPRLRMGWARLRARPAWPEPNPLIAADLAARTGLAERLRGASERRPPAPHTLRGSHYLGLLSGITSAGFETLDRVAAAFGLEPRYPFQDKRLLEFCLALPPEQKFRRGRTRVVLRHAMVGTLPERVRRRGGKADLAPQFRESFLRFERGRIEAVVFAEPQPVARFVDTRVLRDLYRTYAFEGRKQNAERIWNAVMLAIWLGRQGFPEGAGAADGPVVPSTVEVREGRRARTHARSRR